MITAKQATYQVSTIARQYGYPETLVVNTCYEEGLNGAESIVVDEKTIGLVYRRFGLVDSYTMLDEIRTFCQMHAFSSAKRPASHKLIVQRIQRVLSVSVNEIEYQITRVHDVETRNFNNETITMAYVELTHYSPTGNPMFNITLPYAGDALEVLHHTVLRAYYFYRDTVGEQLDDK